MKKTWLKTFTLLFLAIPLCFGEAPKMTAEDLLHQAYDYVNKAVKYSAFAQDLLKKGSDRKNIELAIESYKNACQMFDKSAKIFAALGPDNVSKGDLEGSKNAADGCIQSVHQLERRLPKA